MHIELRKLKSEKSTLCPRKRLATQPRSGSMGSAPSSRRTAGMAPRTITMPSAASPNRRSMPGSPPTVPSRGSATASCRTASSSRWRRSSPDRGGEAAAPAMPDEAGDDRGRPGVLLSAQGQDTRHRVRRRATRLTPSARMVNGDDAARLSGRRDDRPGREARPILIALTASTRQDLGCAPAWPQAPRPHPRTRLRRGRRRDRPPRGCRLVRYRAGRARRGLPAGVVEW